MHRLRGIVFIIVISAVCFWGYSRFFLRPSSFLPVNTSGVQSSVSLAIDNGVTIATYGGILATNAYDALVEASRREKFEVRTKMYDFGVFVEQIGDYPSAGAMAWIFFVNGVSGSVASDKQQVKNGDSILWRYMKPQ